VTERSDDKVDFQSAIPREGLSGLSDKEIGDALDDLIASYGVEAVSDLEKLATGGDYRVAKAVCSALGAVHDVSAANALLRIRKSVKDKQVRKEAGHALHRLRSSGVEPEESPEPVGRMPGFVPSGKIENAYATYYDPVGVRLLIMGMRPSGRPLFRVIWAISQEKGVHDSFVARSSKRGFEEWINEFRSEERNIFRIDPVHCRYIANEAYEKTSHVGASLPDGIGVYLETVKNMPDLPEMPIIYELLDEEEVKSDSTALLVSEELLDLAECEWLLDEEKVAKYRERVLEVVKSVIVTSDIVREERLQRIVNDFISAEFSKDMIEAYRRRLEETAYLFVLDNKMDYARLAFRVALSMKFDNNPGAIPFIRGLVGRNIGIIPADSLEESEMERRKLEEERVQLVKPISQSGSQELFREMLRG